LHIDVGKIGVQGKVVARLFAAGLRTFKVVDGGFDLLTGLFVRATACTEWPTVSST